MQSISTSSPEVSIDSYTARIKAQKELVESLKVQWKLLWSERFSDRVRAEDVSVNDYVSLSVERGTIIHANRDYKALAFKEILEQHMIENPNRYVQPEAHIGGWNKFVRTQITKHSPQKDKPTLLESRSKMTAQQSKKGGRGWLHFM